MLERNHTSRIETLSSTQVRIQLFGMVLRALWICILGATVIIEALPRDSRWGPQLYYPYTAIKVGLFLLLGFATPLAIWNFSSLGLGLVFAATTAGIVEIVQYITPGHRASILELLAKVVLLFGGFAVALVVRNDHALKVGSLSILLVDRHLSESDRVES